MGGAYGTRKESLDSMEKTKRHLHVSIESLISSRKMAELIEIMRMMGDTRPERYPKIRVTEKDIKEAGLETGTNLARMLLNGKISNQGTALLLRKSGSG